MFEDEKIIDIVENLMLVVKDQLLIISDLQTRVKILEESLNCETISEDHE